MKKWEIIIECNAQGGGGGEWNGEAVGQGKAFEAKCLTAGTICGWSKSF